MNENRPVVCDSAHRFQPNWTSIIFFSIFHPLGLLAYPLYLYFGGGVQWQEIFTFFLMFFLGTLGVTIGYHRALSHLSFKMSPVLKVWALIAGASSAEGSALAWCSDHRRHHKFQDTEKDPYNIRRGFWWAHMGWLLGSPTTTDFSNCPDLERDRLVRFQHRYYILWLIVSCFLLPLGLGFILGRPLACFLLAGLTRLFFVNHVTFCINSYAHYFGRRPYSVDLTARDSLICAILANGEGWHNFHHKFPFDYRNGHRFYHYDPTKWLIDLFRLLGLARDLKSTPAQEIYRAKIQTQRTKIVKEPMQLKTLSESLDAALAKWTLLGLEWQKFKSDIEIRKSGQLKVLKKRLRLARREFQLCYSSWKISVRHMRVHDVARSEPSVF
jgi:stearoyl-CoA desaturase (delta-9 desaturase)